MPENKADTSAIQQVELAISRLETLLSLPCVAVQYLRHLSQGQSSALAEIIESDAALTARIFSAACQRGLNLAALRFSVGQIISKLPWEVVRDVILSVKAAGIGEDDAGRALPRRQLAVHNIAVACCAKEIAEAIPGQVDSRSAYAAGLLHDIGKLAIDTAMPKSFVKIAEEAKLRNSSFCKVEQEYLGVDHTILGKRLAVKWRLPEKIVFAIWLHHNNTEAISDRMPEAKIAQIVQLADCISRQYGMGQSGSFDAIDSTGQMAESLGINEQQFEQICRKLPEKVEQRCRALRMDMPNQSAAYCDALYTAAVQLSQQQTKLSQENRQLGTASSYFDFISEILSNIDSASNITEIAERFAVGWQKFYQTGPVCLYLTALSDSQFPAVTVDSMAESKVAYLIPPAGVSAIPEAMENKFAILNAQDCVEWLFEQIDTDFNLSYTKIIPLLCSNKAIGALVFELRYPTDTELFIEDFKAVVSIAATVLDIASDRRNQQGFAERFADLLSGPEKIQPQTEPAAAIAEEKKEIIEEDKTLSALAEMAGGAAHELNNPLSVISGRAQFLAGSESNPEKKRMLKQIQENANELAWIIDGLMTFARPQPPRTEQINIKQILDEAVQLAAQKNGKDKLDIEIDIAGESKDVFVDSAQIVSAIANIFTNALESYADGFGPIKVNAKPDESGDFINVQISDFGCGMDAETLERAALPFFSVKPAGRKRGMGLAHAKRFIQLNKGLLKITSQAGKGTTVIVSLPCK